MLITIAKLATIIVLHGCTQLGKGDMDTRYVDVYMHATAEECILEVKGNVMKEVTDDTIELKHPGGG